MTVANWIALIASASAAIIAIFTAVWNVTHVVQNGQKLDQIHVLVDGRLTAALQLLNDARTEIGGLRGIITASDSPNPPPSIQVIAAQRLAVAEGKAEPAVVEPVPPQLPGGFGPTKS